MTSDDRQERRDKTAAMLEQALGPSWRKRTAEALDLNGAAVRRLFTPPKGRDDAPSSELMALAEFLATVPERNWPPRWRQ